MISNTILKHQHAHFFHDRKQERSAAKLGMWLFLVTEVLLFSGLFVSYAIIRTMHPAMWAEASAMLDVKMGAINTLILISSSFTAALAVRTAQTK